MRQLMIVFIVCAACLSAIQAKKDKKAGIFMLKVKGKGMQNMYPSNYGGGYGYGGQQGGYGGGYGGQQGGYGGQQSGYGGQSGSYQASYGSQPTIIPIYYPVMMPSYHQHSEHVGGYAESALGYGQTAGRNIGITIYPAQTPGDYQPSNNFMAGYNALPMYGGGFASGIGNGYGNSIGSSHSSGGY